MRPIVRKGNEFRINLDAEEIGLIRRLLNELRTLLMGSSDDERLVRLFPTAYHNETDRELDAEYQRLMREELVASRLSGIATLDRAFDEISEKTGRKDKAQLTLDQLMAFMQAVNGLRLVLGTMLDVGEEHDLDELGDDHPLIGEHRLYVYLSWILECSVEALQG